MSMSNRSGTTAWRHVALLTTSMVLTSGLMGGTGTAQEPPHPYVRTHSQGEPRVLDRAIDGVQRRGEATTRPWSPQRLDQPPAVDGLVGSAGDPVCDGGSVAWHGQPLPDGEQGTLSPLAFVNAATLNDEGRIAFYAQVEGADRNQGIFTADAEGLQVIALGCGGAGGSGETAGCGDPSPVGGTFSGFFSGTFFVPDINDSGDVLFLADIHEGDASRSLFLYRADTDTIEKVAAVGDTLTEGGVIAEVGSGNLNNQGMVAFAARLDGAANAAIFLWDGIAVSPYVAVGDPVPGGGVFSFVITESLGFPDGTSIPGGPLPGLNDQGQVSFRGIVDGGEAERGIFLSQDGEHEWLVRAGDPVPGGGTYFDFQAALLNDAGEVAFIADFLDEGDFNSAWIAGSPDNWRRAIAFLDEIGDATVQGMAFSRNPLNALNDEGDVLLWTSLLFPDESTAGAMILSRASGERVVVAQQGEPTPDGGTYGSMDGWPALNDAGQGQVGAGTPGLPGQLNTHFVLTFCDAGEPTLAFDPPSLAFGDVEVGTTSEPQTTILTNTGDAEATGLTFTVDPADGGFDADTADCGAVLAPAESCSISVTFTPPAPGTAAAALSVDSAEGADAGLDLSGNGVEAPPIFAAAGLQVDPTATVGSDGNGVFEPDELVVVAPEWRNDGDTVPGTLGLASAFIGPDGATYTLVDGEADYGEVAAGETASCLDGEDCYEMSVDAPAVRPATLWEATFDETLDDPDGTTTTWTLHIGDSFTDVPRSSPFYTAIETLLGSGITGGCTPGPDGRHGGRPLQGGAAYCPGGANRRAQMPVFMLRALMGSDYTPPPCVEGDDPFGDVPFDSTFCPWIQDLANRGIVSGCGNGDYCPGNPVTRAQMAIFLLKTLEGADYEPPECTEQFTDVPCPSLFADWIEDLAARGITGGCTATEYCPAAAVTRAQMAVFITRAFGFTLYGPSVVSHK